MKKVRKKDYKLTRTERYLARIRYFTDAGVIGSKSFVADMFFQFRDLFQNPAERRPKSVQGVDGVYSMKRLSEIL